MASGIYKLLSPDGHYYIGSSNNIQRRTTKHFQQLRKNRHINRFLQNVYNKHPKEWRVECLEEVPEDKLIKVEQKYLDVCYGKDKCLNLTLVANKPPSAKGRKWSAKSLKKMQNSKLGWRPSSETIHNMTIAARKRCSDPKVIENMKLAFRNRANKREAFYLVINNIKYGPFHSSKECKETTKCNIGTASIHSLRVGKYPNIKGYSIELVK